MDIIIKTMKTVLQAPNRVGKNPAASPSDAGMTCGDEKRLHIR